MSPCHCTLLRKAARRVSALYDRLLAPSGLRVPQYALMAEIGRSGPLTITRLADIMVMDRNGLGHVLRTLARDGLVETRTGEDRRFRVISLTDEGRRRFAEARPYWQDAQRHMVERGYAELFAGPVPRLVSDTFGGLAATR